MRNKHSSSSFLLDYIPLAGIVLILVLFGVCFWQIYKLDKITSSKPMPTVQKEEGITEGEYLVLNVVQSTFFATDTEGNYSEVFLISKRSGGTAYAVKKPDDVPMPSDWETPNDYILKIDKENHWAFIPTEDFKKRKGISSSSQ